MSDWLDEAVHEEGDLMFSDHPESRDLVLYAELHPDLDDGLRRDIEEHLRVCDACYDDLTRLTAADHELTRGASPTAAPGLRDRLAGLLAPRFLIPAVSLIIAAVAVFQPTREASLLTPVGRSIILRPEVERGAAPAIQPDSAGRLSVTFTLPGDGDGPIEHCAATVLAPDGHTVAHVDDMTAFDAYGTFVLVMDVAGLPAGPYRLTTADRLGARAFEFRVVETAQGGR